MKEIKGPVFPVITAFDHAGNVDYEGTLRYISYLCQCGAQTIYFMAHSSRLNLLSIGEIETLNTVIPQDIKYRFPDVTVICATPPYGSTLDAIESAKIADAYGADFVSVIFTERYYSEEQVYSFFRDISDSVSCEILVHSEPMRSIYGNTKAHYSMELLDRIFDIENVTAIKEDSNWNLQTDRIVHRYRQESSIIVSGGSKEQFMEFNRIGCHAYLVGIGSVFPAFAFSFYAALCVGDYDTCKFLINNFERPFFSVTKKIGWHIALKAALNCVGLMNITERRPLVEVTDEQYNEIHKMMDNLKLV